MVRSSTLTLTLHDAVHLCAASGYMLRLGLWFGWGSGWVSGVGFMVRSLTLTLTLHDAVHLCAASGYMLRLGLWLGWGSGWGYG